MGVLADEYIRLRPDVSGMPREIRKAGDEAGKNFSTSFADTTKGLLKKGLVAAGITAGVLFATAIKKGFGRLSAIEDATAKLEGLGHSAGEVKKIMVNALASVKGTAFGLDEAATVAASAVASGIKPGKQLERTLKLVGDAATIGGDSLEGMGAIFTQVAASNKVQGDTIQQLNDRGIPILKLLSQVTGKSQEDVRKLASKGKIDFETFQKAMEKGLGGAALKSGDTASGAFKNMGAAFSRVGAALLHDVFPKIHGGISKITGWLDEITPVAEDIGKKIGKLLTPGKVDLPKIDLKLNTDGLFKSLSDAAKKYLPEVKTQVHDLVVSATPELQSVADTINKDVIPAMTDLAENSGPAVKSALHDLGPVIGGIVKVLLFDVQWMGIQFAAVLTAMSWAVKHILTPALDGIGQFFDDAISQAGRRWHEIVDPAEANIKAIGGFFAGLWADVTGWVTRTWTDITTSFTGGVASIIASTQHFVDPIVHSFVFTKEKAVAWVQRMWADIKTSFITSHAEVVADVKAFVTPIVAWFANLAGRVIGWVSRMWSSVKASFVKNHAEVAADIRGFFATIGGVFSGGLAKLRGLWTVAWNGIKKTASDVMGSIKTVLKDGLTKVAEGFGAGVKAIGRAWDGLIAVAKVPVKFVIETVLNDGLLAAVRAISKFVDYGPGKNVKVSLPKNWASGTSQVLPGYSPGRDIHRFYSATGGILDLSGGEGIARPELVRAVGKKRWDEANRASAHGRVDDAMHYLGGYAQGSSGIAATKAYARSIGLGSGSTYPGHGELGSNLSWDFMTGSNRQTAKGNQLANWAWSNARAISLWYEIYFRRIRSMTRPSAGWTPYTRYGANASPSQAHLNHVHLSFYRSALGGVKGGLVGAGAGGGGGGGLGFLDPAKYLKMATDAIAKLKQIKNSPFGEMVAGIPELIVDKIKAKITDLAATFAAPTPGAAGGKFTAAGGGSNRAIGHRMMLQRWGESQWPPLNSLWTRESGWRTTAKNPSSGAYGIPQSLPGSKMASAGSDWRTNPATQIKWGLGYIASRYGSPSGAWAHSQRTGWYDQGGLLKPGLTMALNTTGRDELVTPLPRGWQNAARGGASSPRPITILIDLGDGLTQKVQGLIDDNDEFHASVGRAR